MQANLAEMRMKIVLMPNFKIYSFGKNFSDGVLN